MKNLYSFFAIVFVFLCANAVAQPASPNSSDDSLSFAPWNTCKMPKKSPPKAWLTKKYNIETEVGPWQILDINGDGWCDWVRGGPAPYRSNVDEPPLRDFIYLGRRVGFGVLRNSVDGFNCGSKHCYFGNTRSRYQSIFVYSKKSQAPYVIFVNWSSLSPLLEKHELPITQWDGEADLLSDIPDEGRKVILDFLRRELCKEPPGLRPVYDGNEFMLASSWPGELCEK